MLFKNRKDAGVQLGAALARLSLKEGLIIGLPRGGVVVAAEVARLLHFPLDIIIPRKIGAPANSELAIGALLEETVLLNDELIQTLQISDAYLKNAIAKEKQEAKRRLSLYRPNRPAQNFKGQTVIIVDDGIATGFTMRVSIQYLLSKQVKRLIVAVPVAPQDTIQTLKNENIEVVCLYTPATFYAIGQFYEEFPQTEDAEVIKLLR
jgi:putative phosphoribosyl transferase